MTDPNRTDCALVREQLDSDPEGWGVGVAARVADHLDRCGECRREFEAGDPVERSEWAELDAVPLPSDAEWARVDAALDTAFHEFAATRATSPGASPTTSSTTSSTTSPENGAPLRSLFIPLAAALVVGIVLFSFLGYREIEENSLVAQESAVEILEIAADRQVMILQPDDGALMVLVTSG